MRMAAQAYVSAPIATMRDTFRPTAMAAPALEARHFHPRWWPTWIGIGLLWMLSWLPIPLLLATGSALGWLAGRLLGGRRRIVRVNLELCFPELDENARATMVDAHFRALGSGLFAAAVAWFSPDWRLHAPGQHVGPEHPSAT